MNFQLALLLLLCSASPAAAKLTEHGRASNSNKDISVKELEDVATMMNRVEDAAMKEKELKDDRATDDMNKRFHNVTPALVELEDADPLPKEEDISVKELEDVAAMMNRVEDAAMKEKELEDDRATDDMNKRFHNVTPALVELEDFGTSAAHLESNLVELHQRTAVPQDEQLADPEYKVVWTPANQAFVSGETPLHSAARLGQFAKVEELIQHGADVNAVDTFGRTPLHLAVFYQRVFVVQMLIDKGANKDLQDDLGRAPLHLAVIQKSVSVVQMLIEAGANKDLQDDLGETPLHLAAFPAENDDMVQMLIEAGADKDLQDNEGLTPLDLANKFGQDSTVKLFFEQMRNSA